MRLKLQTQLFISLIALILANLALSLSLTFTVPPGDDPWTYMTTHSQWQLAFFFITSILIILFDFILLFGFREPVSLLPPFQLSSIYGLLVPVLFLSIYFVKRPVSSSNSSTTSFQFYELIPVTFYNLLFYVVLGLFNSVVENVKAVKGGKIKP